MTLMCSAQTIICLTTKVMVKTNNVVCKTALATPGILTLWMCSSRKYISLWRFFLRSINVNSCVPTRHQCPQLLEATVAVWPLYITAKRCLQSCSVTKPLPPPCRHPGATLLMPATGNQPLGWSYTHSLGQNYYKL